LAVLKQISNLSEQQKTNLTGILHVIIKKMKYDESYNFEHEVYLCHSAGGRLWPCFFIARKFFLLTGESDQYN